MGKGIITANNISALEGLIQEEQELFAVYDTAVSPFAESIIAAIPACRLKGEVQLETSEKAKTMDTVLDICRRMMDAGLSRGALVLAIGGGITTDMTGFASAMYKRGVRYANIPTTLLAQVDAAVGGKTGVNLDGYKNMAGAFHMPEFTFIYPPVLETLPGKELKCGLAEMAKTFLIADAKAYRQLMDGGISAELIQKAASIKAEIVARDPLEKGERAVLNLGHTFGHAIESCSRGAIAHGEAVSMGIILAAKMSEEEGVAIPGLAGTIEADFTKAGLPTECPFPPETLHTAMLKDKKAGAGTLRYVLLESPGHPVIIDKAI